MNITAYFKWGLNLDKHVLTHEDVFDSSDDCQNNWFLKFDKFPRLGVSYFKKGFNGSINIDIDFLIHFLICQLFYNSIIKSLFIMPLSNFSFNFLQQSLNFRLIKYLNLEQRMTQKLRDRKI